MLEVPYGSEKNLCKTPLPFRNEGSDCLGRREHKMMKPLKDPRNIQQFQYLDMVNAPAEGQAVAARWCPPGGVVLQLLSLLQVSLKCKAFQHVSARPRAGIFVTIQTDTWGKLGISPKTQI